MNKFIMIAVVWVMCKCGLAQTYQIPISDASSLVRVGMNPHPTSAEDTQLAYMLMSALDRRDTDSLTYLCNIYKKKAADERLNEKAWGALAYILDRLPSQYRGTDQNCGDVLTDDLYHYFTDNDCFHLRNYLVLKYELNNYRPRSVKEHINQRTFYDDLLMFNDPYRKEWDNTDDAMRMMPIKEGDTVVDVGCGFGYNSFKLLQLVGLQGMVYATDTEKAYIDHLRAIATRNGIGNLKPMVTQSNDLGVADSVDCVVMSSLYHIIYTWSREDERNSFLSSLKSHLRHGGYLVIIDNINLHGEELNNCHVDYRLVEAQLGYWGFRRVSYNQLNRQRYMLVLQRDDDYQPNVSTCATDFPVLCIKDRKSVVHIGSLDSYDITDWGTDAAQYVYDFMSTGNRALGEIAIKKYNEIIPKENFGGEYSALQWLCEAMLASDHQREYMLKDPLVCSFYHKLTDDSCRVARYYLLHKYKLGSEKIRMLSDSILEISGEVGRTHRSYLEDYILALNPKRPLWEQTSKIINHLGMIEGMKVVDVGCGSGYFTYQFSKIVGDKGRVYALEIKDEHIASLKYFLEQQKIGNVDVLKGKEDNITLPEPVDKIFMCSLYHIMYGVMSDSDRDAYLNSLIKCLKPDGELIIVDNGPVDDGSLPYHGPYIQPKLIENQLYYYGFKLSDFIQIIPQRYMIKFKLTNKPRYE